MKLVPYVEAIASSSDKKNADLAPSRAAETQKRIELKIAELDTALLTKENEIAQYAGRYPLDVASLQALMDQHAVTTRQRDQLKAVVNDLFPAK